MNLHQQLSINLSPPPPPPPPPLLPLSKLVTDPTSVPRSSPNPQQNHQILKPPEIVRSIYLTVPPWEEQGTASEKRLPSVRLGTAK